MPTPELLNYIRNELEKSLSVEDLKTNLISAGWQSEVIEAAIAEVQSSALAPPIIKDEVLNFSQSLDSLEVTPGFLNSFSWGYFGTSLVYAIAMRLSLFQIFQPLLFNLFVVLVSIPLAFTVGLIPIFGPLFLLLFKTITPFYLLYRASHTVRSNAYTNRKWESPGDFIKCQMVWDMWGKICVIAGFIVGMILIFISYQIQTTKRNAKTVDEYRNAQQYEQLLKSLHPTP